MLLPFPVLVAIAITGEVAFLFLLPSLPVSLLAIFVGFLLSTTSTPLFLLFRRLVVLFGSVRTLPAGITFFVHVFLVDVSPAVTIFSVAVTVTTVIFPVIVEL
jgi:hypothetical protein